MKLVIQIPCYNEEEFLAGALDALPRRIDGVDSIEVLVIDDGSSDATSEAARRHPAVAKVIRLPTHQGLAVAFMAGIEAALEMSADIIVNTDADNQYPASRIPDLIRPIVEGRAEFVIGCRNIEGIAHFSHWKKLAQRAGSRVVSAICRQSVPDVTSGFRAFSRNSALWLDVIGSNYTYTLETLIRLASRKVRIAVIEVEVNPPVRTSRLMKSSIDYIFRSIRDILTLFYIYSPLKLFVFFAFVFGLPGLFLVLRFLYFYAVLTVMRGLPAGYMQSLTIGTALLITGVFMLLMGVLSNLIYINRKIQEKVLFQLQKNRKS
ncbi:MAG: glycosyltransferase family 2 protein [Elusimicrobiota bacterium]|nr:glycosyltransferase family 2 protein [Elusimicrobiota bacterium]